MNLETAARNAVSLAKPKRRERLLVVTDPPTMEIGLALYTAAAEKCEAVMMVIEPTGQHGREPPKPVAKAMLGYDIIFAPTKHSLTHTNAVRAARRKGARIATLPSITKPTFLRGMSADYRKVKAAGDALKKKFARAEWAHITAQGTDIWLHIGGRQLFNDDGDLSSKGSLNNLPAGEVAVSPTEGKSYGEFTGTSSTKSGISFTVGKGKVTACSNKKYKERIWAVPSRRNIAELGIGTNPKAKLSGKVLEDEKVLGTCHIAVGDSKSLGGKVNSDLHIDFIINKPTIYFDDKEIMRKGVFT